MAGEKNIAQLLKNMQPELHTGNFVFCTIDNFSAINQSDVVMLFKEQEGVTVIVKKETADVYKLPYSFVASWITLTIHSSLEAVGLTAAFSNALAAENISCNVVAAFYHDHIFVDTKDAAKAIDVLNRFSDNQ